MSKPSRSFLLLLLGCLSLVLLLVLWTKAWYPSSPSLHATGHSAAPQTCAMWIQLDSPTTTPSVLCFQRGELHTRRAVVMRHLSRAVPGCSFAPRFPLPAHGQRLTIRKHPQRRKGPSCTVYIHPMTGERRVALGIPLSVNHDSARALAAVPGLSQRVAQRIVAYRKKHGAFHNLEALTAIRGIGSKTIQRLRPFLKR